MGEGRETYESGQEIWGGGGEIYERGWEIHEGGENLWGQEFIAVLTRSGQSLGRH